ncbi:MAG: DUF3794 domain-containing protein [Oscillospiraceae bacterium]|nr:DUF3794 domain-containing protein [Oscillospiraceae bacterium]
MELKVTKELITTGEAAFDSFSELPIEYDLLLPDYCPDMVKILRCAVTPVFSRTEVSGDKLLLEGSCAISLFYADSQSAIRVSEHKSPFSKTVELRCTPESPAVFAGAAVDYVNCRAVSGRRADVRGAFTVSIRVLGQRREEVVSAAEGDGIQLHRAEVLSHWAAGKAARSFTVREELELSPARAAVGHIIRHSETARMTDCKIIAGKVVTKGELRIHLLYMPREGGRPETMDYTLPVSQIVDIEGADEECGCDAYYAVRSAEISPRTDLDGESRAFSAEVTLEVQACVTRPGRTAAVTDAYSTGYETSYSIRPVTVLRRLENTGLQALREETVELPEEAEEVLDLWTETAGFSAQTQDGEWILTGKYRICLFAQGQEGTPVYLEHPAEFELRRPLPPGCDSVFAGCRVLTEDAEYSVTGVRQLGVRLLCRAEGALFGSFQYGAVNELKVERGKARKQEGAALTLYYAGAGEDVWEIAKHFGTSVLAVMEENGLEKETLGERKMLLIPQVG